MIRLVIALWRYFAWSVTLHEKKVWEAELKSRYVTLFKMKNLVLVWFFLPLVGVLFAGRWLEVQFSIPPADRGTIANPLSIGFAILTGPWVLRMYYIGYFSVWLGNGRLCTQRVARLEERLARIASADPR
ncbi:MAG: hypothetical protein AAF674_15065 [Pseudomonadota bacterium]